jgi:hypothetical protein
MDASAMKTLADVKMENIGYNSDRSVRAHSTIFLMFFFYSILALFASATCPDASVLRIRNCLLRIRIGLQ